MNNSRQEKQMILKKYQSILRRTRIMELVSLQMLEFQKKSNETYSKKTTAISLMNKIPEPSPEELKETLQKMQTMYSRKIEVYNIENTELEQKLALLKKELESEKAIYHKNRLGGDEEWMMESVLDSVSMMYSDINSGIESISDY